MFIRLSSLTIALFARLALAGANLIPLQEHVGTEDLFPMEDCSRFKLHEATLDEMQTAMHSGQLTSVQLVTCYLLRTYQTQEYIK